MRIGVVSAHYMPEVGYQEVHLAKAFARNGHTVKVFTSAAQVKLGGKVGQVNYETGLSHDAKLGYEILRLPSISFKSKVIPFGLKKSVLEFKPDVLIILGVAKIFPLSLLSKSIYSKIKSVSVYGDAKEYLDRDTFKQKIKTFFHELGYATIKKNLYKKAVAYNHRLILNIPETDEVFQHFVNDQERPVYESKKVMLNLGFDPTEYYYNENDRNEVRKELGFTDDDTVIITSTRINKRKNLEKIIRLVSELNLEGKKVKYILVGFLGDDYERELKAFIQSQPKPEAFICYQFLNSKEIRKLYCAADTGIWLKAAISIQEAMGTGLPVILENKPSVNHLIKDNVTGWFFEKNNFDATIKKVTSLLSEKKANREKLVKENSIKLSYDHIAQKILSTLDI